MAMDPVIASAAAEQEFGVMQRERLKPGYGERATFVPDSVDATRRLVRWVFSPFLDIDTTCDPVPFSMIRQGVLWEVANYPQRTPNYQAISDAFGDPNKTLAGDRWRFAEREAAAVFEGLMRSAGSVSSNGVNQSTPTGLMEIKSLRGMDPAADAKVGQLLDALQEILWPYNCDSAAEHRKILESFDVRALEDPADADIFLRVRHEMNQAIALSERFCRSEIQELRGMQRDSANGKAKGNRITANDHEKRCLLWIGEEEPHAASSQADVLYAMVDKMTAGFGAIAANAGAAGGAGSDPAIIQMLLERMSAQDELIKTLLAGGRPLVASPDGGSAKTAEQAPVIEAPQEVKAEGEPGELPLVMKRGPGRPRKSEKVEVGAPIDMDSEFPPERPEESE